MLDDSGKCRGIIIIIAGLKIVLRIMKVKRRKAIFIKKKSLFYDYFFANLYVYTLSSADISRCALLNFNFLFTAIYAIYTDRYGSTHMTYLNDLLTI